ncbi:uncharacterized protein AtWU_09754 [Aspergillus tubingensis]|uniref:uncharacterized protein n=1 Tax=Aspergillus tubingensis TaxID=5068 RepID=UPI001579E140|nr:uncharacterized protein AtWU_09754 [Aspergillus tubingensis]GFN19949.1 hypothetical protein AtWU_09754 [Aspergillus tubingensis]
MLRLPLDPSMVIVLSPTSFVQPSHLPPITAPWCGGIEYLISHNIFEADLLRALVDLCHPRGFGKNRVAIPGISPFLIPPNKSDSLSPFQLLAYPCWAPPKPSARRAYF